MGRLLAFLYAYRNWLWFIGIQAISIWMLAVYNDRHSQVFGGWGDGFSNTVHNTNASISGYFNLSEDNEKLVRENIRLRRELISLRQELDAYKYRVPLSDNYSLLPDSLRPDEQYRFLPCKAMYSTTNSEFNYIKLDVGRKDGVRENMGVVSESGVAGVIVEVKENYSLAMSLLNTKMRVPARIHKENILGTFHWDKGDPRYGYLENVPLHFVIKKGAKVVTSPQSAIFPPEFVLGTIDEVDKEQPEGFYNIRVRLNTDFYRIHYLYLVQNTRQDELDSLNIPTP